MRVERSGEDHELTESQMNFLLRLNPEIGLLGGAARFHVLQTIGGKPRFLLSANDDGSAAEEDEDGLPSPIPVLTSFGEDDDEGDEEAALREALALSLAGGEEPAAEEGSEDATAKAPGTKPKERHHPALDLQKSVDEWRRSDTATRAIIVGVHPVTDEGAAGWGHWVAFVANKLAGSREYLLLDSDNHPLLSFRDAAILNAYRCDNTMLSLQSDTRDVSFGLPRRTLWTARAKYSALCPCHDHFAPSCPASSCVTFAVTRPG